LAGGVLSGKYQAGDTEGGRYDSDMMKSFLPAQERQGRVVSALRQVSEQTGRSLAQVALAWLRYRPVPVIPIIGSRRIAQLEDNLASLTLTLSPEQVTALDEASAIEMGFPHDFYSKDLVRNFIFGGMRDRILA
jgi:aryl-alcohol dehydrogenase-like predicted oxidoreductase